MLEIWRAALGYDESRTDCTVEVYDGREINEVLSRAMRAWYLGLLDTASPALLPTRATTARSTEAAGTAIIRAALPADMRRPLMVDAPRWSRPAAVETGLDRLRDVDAPYGCPDAASPMAALAPDGSLLLAPLDDGDAFTVTGVYDPGPAQYTLDESFLSTIPATIPGYEQE